MKKISIIIPHYKEDEGKIVSILEMINNQIGINFMDIEVIVSSDGEEAYPLHDNDAEDAHKLEWSFQENDYVYGDIYFCDDYEFPVYLLRSNENGGPGVARERGIDICDGQFVMFIDADDMLHNVAVLNYYINEIDTLNGEFDMLSTHWIEEQYNKETGKMHYIHHGNDLTWMFAKLINKKFLDEKEIAFHDDLRVHEDSHFLSRVNFNSTPDRMRVSDVVTYVWKYSDSTITRINNAEYTYNSYAEFLRAHGLALSKNVMLNKPDAITEAVVQLMCYAYFTLNAPHWDAYPEYKEDAIISLRNNICNPFKAYIDGCPMDKWTALYKNEQQKHGYYIERDNMYNWLVKNDIYTPPVGEEVEEDGDN